MPNYVHPRLDPNDRFRERRRHAIVTRRRRRLAVATILLAVGAGLGAGATVIGGSKHNSSAPAISQAPVSADKPNLPRAYPREVRGVHVTMALAGLEGKIEEYVALKAYGLNTLEVDVKDENGKIGFTSPYMP